jgi:hypothetical protein
MRFCTGRAAHRWSRGIALLFRDDGTRNGGEWLAARSGRILPPGKTRDPLYRRLGGPPGPVWTGGKSLPHRNSIPDRPARSQSLYPLSYPAQSLPCKPYVNSGHLRGEPFYSFNKLSSLHKACYFVILKTVIWLTMRVPIQKTKERDLYRQVRTKINRKTRKNDKKKQTRTNEYCYVLILTYRGADKSLARPGRKQKCDGQRNGLIWLG